MTARCPRLPILLLAGCLTGWALSAGGPAQAVPVTFACGSSSWTAVPTPAGGITGNIRGMAALSSTDAWAVGSWSDSIFPGDPSHPLTDHWNGTKWHRIPNPPVESGGLSIVEAIATNDVWAAGAFSSAGVSGTLFEHWDGSRWRKVPSPAISDYAPLLDLGASSSNDVWAVGTDYGSTTTRTLIEHWNGQRWRIYPRSFPGNLSGVAVITPTDAWAVGYSAANRTQTVILHWDGAGWSRTPSPDVSSQDFLMSVAAVSASDVWAADWDGLGNTLLEHWNGSTWTAVGGEDPYSYQNLLFSISAFPSGAVWAAGWGKNDDFIPRPLTEKWTGSSWVSVPAPDFPRAGISLYSVSISSSGAVWAADTSNGMGTPFRPLRSTSVPSLHLSRRRILGRGTLTPAH